MSAEAWIGVALVGVIVVSGVLVLTRFTGPRRGGTAAQVIDAGTPSVDARAVAMIDAGPSVDPFTLTITASPDEKRRLGAAAETHIATRRGVPFTDYYVFLTALDTQLASLTLAPDGTAEEPASLPPLIGNAVTEERLDDAVAATMAYVRATGELPPLMKSTFRSFVAGRASVAADEKLQGAKRLPPWSAAAIAVWLTPTDPRRLTELAYANDVLSRWCDAPEPPRRHFAPVLCERQALIEQLRAVAPTDPASAALENWAVATPFDTPAPAGDGTVTVRDVTYETGGRVDTMTISVTVELAGPAPATTAVLTGGWIKTPIEPVRIDTGDGDAGVASGGTRKRFTFAAPRRIFSPVLRMGASTLRLPPAPWGG
jgi:hypothetical protein